MRDLTFDFGDLLEIRGDFAIGNDGSFHGSSLEVFVGRGPSKKDGADNPDAVGVLIKNATIDFQKGTAGFALRVTGSIALLGLDGLALAGSVAFQVNTTNADVVVSTGVTVAKQTYELRATITSSASPASSTSAAR